MRPKALRGFYEALENALKEKEILPGKSGRHMKYPYTISAKIAQFPYFYYMKHNWIWMYYPMGFLGGLWGIYKIHKLVNSESNVKAYHDTLKKYAERAAHGH